MKKEQDEKKLILIVEDDQYISYAYLNGLKRAGYKVVSAVDGEEAMEKLKYLRPGLIILDLLIPRKNGIAVLREIKENKDLRNIPVIINSNLDQKEEIKMARELGACDYLVKANTSMEALLEKVEKYI